MGIPWGDKWVSFLLTQWKSYVTPIAERCPPLNANTLSCFSFGSLSYLTIAIGTATLITEMTVRFTIYILIGLLHFVND